MITGHVTGLLWDHQTSDSSRNSENCLNQRQDELFRECPEALPSTQKLGWWFHHRVKW